MLWSVLYFCQVYCSWHSRLTVGSSDYLTFQSSNYSPTQKRFIMMLLTCNKCGRKCVWLYVCDCMCVRVCACVCVYGLFGNINSLSIGLLFLDDITTTYQGTRSSSFSGSFFFPPHRMKTTPKKRIWVFSRWLVLRFQVLLCICCV